MSKRILDGRVLISDLNEEPVEHVQIGDAQRLVTKEDAPCSISSLSIGPNGTKHYHRFTTEIFMCTSGKGYITVDGERVDFHPGVVVVVKPGTIHLPVSEDNLVLTTICVPPFMEPIDRVAVADDVDKVYA